MLGALVHPRLIHVVGHVHGLEGNSLPEFTTVRTLRTIHEERELQASILHHTLTHLSKLLCPKMNHRKRVNWMPVARLQVRGVLRFPLLLTCFCRTSNVC